MPIKSSQTIADRLNAAQVAINNTLTDTEIQSLVAAYGYTAAKMNEGKQLYDLAFNGVNAQIAAAGAQRDKTANTNAAQTTAQQAYQDLSQVARAAFGKDKTRLAALGLTGAMPKTTSGFITAAYALFDNALKVEDIQKLLATYGYDPAKLHTERAKIAAFESANQAQEAAKGAAHQATREQDAALAALRDWLAQYIKIAKVALRDKKELLTKLGVLAASGGRPKKPATDKKPAPDSSAKEG
jgi:hypothetical protein